MNILEKIVQLKRSEVLRLKKQVSLDHLKESELFNKNRPSFFESLKRPGPSVISEFKRKSPSKGVLNRETDIIDVTSKYEKAGVSAISVLTDRHFEGDKEDLVKVFGSVSVPLLRKDFIIDEFQVFEARAIGASAILLIASVLEKKEIENISELAAELGMDVLLELYSLEELDKVPGNVKIIGINNRNLKTFRVDIEQSIRLAEKLPDHVIKVSESGISMVSTIKDLYNKGFKAFLMGEKFMQMRDPGRSCIKFMNELGNSFVNGNTRNYEN